MTLSSALGAALTGLSAASRRAEVVSSNIANASTPGYARRQVELASGLVGGLAPGVRVEAVNRQQDLLLLTQRREAQADLAGAETRAGFFAGLEAAIGLPGEPGSLGARLSEFETALIEAASRPDSEARLHGVAAAATQVALSLNDLSGHVQDARLQADAEISRAVEDLNTGLDRIVSLNNDIVKLQAAGRDVSALIDARQVLIDGIADLVPIRQVPRSNGAVTLYTSGGALLVDSKAAEFGFTAATAVTVHRTQANGGLSGLTLNGQPVTTGAADGPVSGGRLAALFDVRDGLAPAMQAELDALARNLVERFQDPAVDPTLAAGDPGLFTDAGAALDLAEEAGLSGRIALNPLADPRQGGAWRVRDGLGAAAPGDPGNAAILNAMSAAMDDARAAGSGSFTSPHSAIGLAGDLLSHVGTVAYQQEATVVFYRGAAEALVAAELADGVDTDQEMQELMLIEQAYAANARMLAALDEMMQEILRI